MLESGRVIASDAIRLRALIEPLAKIKEAGEEFVEIVNKWSACLLAFSQSLSSLDEMVEQKERFNIGWVLEPANFSSSLETIQKKVQTRPDKGAAAVS